MKGVLVVLLLAVAFVVGLTLLTRGNLGPCETMWNAHLTTHGHKWRGHRVDCIDGVLVKIDGRPGVETR